MGVFPSFPLPFSTEEVPWDRVRTQRERGQKREDLSRTMEDKEKIVIFFFKDKRRRNVGRCHEK